jgi:hypothetical protein
MAVPCFFKLLLFMIIPNLLSGAAFFMIEFLVHFFPHKEIVNAINFLDLLENCALPHLQQAELQNEIWFQQNGTPLHFPPWCNSVSLLQLR